MAEADQKGMRLYRRVDSGAPTNLYAMPIFLSLLFKVFNVLSQWPFVIEGQSGRVMLYFYS